MIRPKSLLQLILLLCFGLSARVAAAPGDVLFSENFNGNLNDWVVDDSGGGDAGISGATSDQGRSLFLRWDSVSVTSASAIDTAVPGAEISIWVRRGDDNFSENPDEDEDLVIEYLNSSSTYIALETFAGDGTPGEIFTRTYTIPADGLHSGFRVRIRLVEASGSNSNNSDFWHVDSLVVTETAAAVLEPIADWRMDALDWNGTSGEVGDSSANNYNGTAIGATTTTGFICNAGDFTATGTTDYLLLDNRAIDGLTDFTLSAWVQTTNGSSQGILSGSTGSQHNELTWWWSSQNAFQPLVKGSGSGGSIGARINNGDWRHLVWRRSGAQNCLFVDGVQQGSCVNRSASALSIASGGLILAQEQDSLGGGFDPSQDWEGLIDEFLVFDSPLSDVEISQIYSNQLAGNNWDGSARSCPIEILPVAEYQMDELSWSGNAGEVVDSGANGLDGTANNDLTTQQDDGAITGNPGTCGFGEFDGDDDYISLGNPASLNFSGEITIAAWIRPDSDNGLRNIVSHGHRRSPNQEIIFRVNSGNYQVGSWNGSNHIASFAIPAGDVGTGQWVHLAATYDGATWSLYRNGVLEASHTDSVGAITVDEDWAIGARGTGTERFFDGGIDEVQIYSMALEQSAVQSIMNETHSCPQTALAEWHFDDASWTNPGDVIDSGSNGFNGSPLGNSQSVPTPSLPPSAIAGSEGTCGYGSFPLNTDAATIDAVDTGLDIDTNIGSVGTIALWYNSNTDWNGGGARTLFDAAKDAGQKYFFLTLLNNGQLRFGLEDTSDGDWRFNSPTQSFSSGQWVHVAASWDLPNDRFEMFIDGASVATYTPNTNGTIGDLDNLFIGDNNGIYIINNDTTPNSANGFIDEVSVFDAALDASQVTIVKNTTRPCAAAGPVRLDVSVSNSASTCVPQDVTIRACADAACSSLDTNYTGAVELTTSTNNGIWSGFAGATGNDDGQALYTFSSSDSGSVTLQLANQRAQSLTITADDSANASLAYTSTQVTYSDNAFVITDVDTRPDENIAVAGRDHLYKVEMYQRDTSQSPSNCSVATTYNSPSQPIKAWVSRNGLATAASPSIGGVALPNSASATITLDFSSDGGGTAYFDLATTDVGRYSIELLDDSNSFADVDVSGVSIELVVRPFGLAITVASVDDNGDIFTSAGSPFSTTITAVAWQAGDDDDGDGVANSGADLTDNAATLNFGQEPVAESVALSHSLVAPLPGNDGDLANGSFASFIGGVSNRTDVSWSEVGIIDLSSTLADGDYLGTGDVTGSLANLGRFIPHHFRVDSGTVTEACIDGSGFSYMQQDFTVDYRVRAENQQDDVTENYTGSFIRLDSGVAGSSISMGAVDGSIQLSTRLNPVNITAATSFSWADGEGDLTTTLNLSRDADGTGPYTMQLGVIAEDADGVISNNVDLDIGGVDYVSVGTSNQRYGRVFMENAFGPETRDLDVPFVVQYFNSATDSFVTHNEDTCFRYIRDSFSEVTGSYTLNLNDADTNPTAPSSLIGLDNGMGRLTLSLPGAGNNGSVDIEFAVPAYLLFDWDSDASVDDNPVSTATFGTYRGNDRIIYRNEVLR